LLCCVATSLPNPPSEPVKVVFASAAWIVGSETACCVAWSKFGSDWVRNRASDGEKNMFCAAAKSTDGGQAASAKLRPLRRRE
jgi:hypothetical protein